jgi:hypothetical protein
MPFKWALTDRVFTMRWGPPALGDAEALLEACEQASRSIGKQLILIMLIPPDVPPPEGAVREAFGRCSGRLLDCCETVHCVIEGDGFKSSIKRSVTTSVLVLSGKRGKMLVHKTFLDALETLRPRLQELKLLSSAIVAAAQVKGLLSKGSRAADAASPPAPAR